MKGITEDEDAEVIKNALDNRRKEIINCLYSIDEDHVSLVLKGGKPLNELNIKYENRSINEEYSKEVEIILQGKDYNDIEDSVHKISYKQRDNRYTNFFRNFKFFKEQLGYFDSTKLNTFAKKLLKDCQVIVVVSYQTEEAIEIFNSLNSTGMPLADADIISAKLYAEYEENKRAFNTRWKDIIENTNSLTAQKISTIDDILNQYMYILRAKRNEKDTTIPGVRRYFTSINKDSLNCPETFISDMEKVIGIWKDEEESALISSIKQVLFKHNNNFRFFYATYFYFNFNESLVDKKEKFEELLKLFAILAIREQGYSSAQFKSFLIALNMEIGKGIDSDELVNKIKAHIKKEFDEKEIYEKIKTSQPNNATVYLNEFLYAREKGKLNVFNGNRTEIEHIMPASGKNISAIREDAGLDEEEFKLYVNMIGNKILLEQSINGSISNEWFKVKKQRSIIDKKGYKDSNFEIAKSLTAYKKDKWEKNDIEKATEKASARITTYIFN